MYGIAGWKFQSKLRQTLQGHQHIPVTLENPSGKASSTSHPVPHHAQSLSLPARPRIQPLIMPNPSHSQLVLASSPLSCPIPLTPSSTSHPAPYHAQSLSLPARPRIQSPITAPYTASKGDYSSMITFADNVQPKMVEQNWRKNGSWERMAGMPLQILNRTEAHWFLYPPPSSSAHAVVTVFYVLIFLLGTGGNGAVLYLTIRFKNLSKKTNSFMLNLAVSDFLMMFTIPIIVVNSFHEGPVLGIPGIDYRPCADGFDLADALGSGTIWHDLARSGMKFIRKVAKVFSGNVSKETEGTARRGTPNQACATPSPTASKASDSGDSNEFKAIGEEVLAFESNTVGGGWRPGCDAIGFIGGLTGTVSIVTLSAISLERFHGIRNCWQPGSRFTWPAASMTRWQRLISITMFWLYGFLFSAIPLVVPGILYVPEGYLTTCSFNYLATDPANIAFILVFFVAAWLLPFIVITSSYIGIMCLVTRNYGVLESANPDNRWQRQQEWKIFKTVVILVVVWFLAWTPYACVSLLGITGMKDLISPASSMIPAIICKICSAIDPFIYTLTHPYFKRELRRHFNVFRRLFEEEKRIKTFSFKANDARVSTSHASLSQQCHRCMQNGRKGNQSTFL
ncbi:unnamed protein product [Darwinula stevensoni]|uniref:G-protein coupled receptors family 1 profile domain-containing protein n=1 Tax=Darwinula stevensoni TaxID=69355 RepID=A0A7R9A7A0_9CRUS|nr:unnamed protein product [Darwinula stevensoni]CAG0890880.1 unnamed protein product [Darwinula stevensoni]